MKTKRLLSGSARVLMLSLLLALPASCTKDDSHANGQGPTCEMPDVPEPDIDPGAAKFSLTMFHYNLEYVVGGLEGFDGYDSFCGELCDGWDNDDVEDWIIRETFKPVLDFYLAHPRWRVNLEMQAYMIEVLEKRFPEVLDELREAVAAGIAEVTSFHYADQLFLAYPKEHQERSWKLTKEIFEQNCIPLSGVVFNQEGQAGEGRQKFLAEHGYTIGVFPKNLFKYFRSGEAFWPYYKTKFGAYMIIGPGDLDASSGIRVSWPFFDDGELLATGDFPPYAAPLSKYNPESMKEYEKKLQELEDQGFKSVTISEYVKHLQAKGVTPKDAPPLLDGTWQPPSTDSIHRWLGGVGDAPYSPGHEQDNNVRSGNARAGAAVKAAEVLVSWLGDKKGGREDLEKRVEALWKKLLRAEVSDATGVNPWAGEVHWSLSLNEEIQDEVEAIVAEVKRITGTEDKILAVDTLSGDVRVLDDMPEENLEKVDAPLEGFQVSAPGRDTTVTWYKVSKERYRVVLDFGTVNQGEDRTITVTFPWTDDKIVYSPGLMDDELVEYSLADFSFSMDEVYLPLPNGLIGLGEGWFAIKHVMSNHIAVRVPASGNVLQFIDETQQPDQPVTWKFELLEADSQEALKVAERINIAPVVFF